MKTREFGYHINDIPKGKLGEISKIQEEFLEFLDANEQKCKVLELIELSDLLGAIEIYLKEKYDGKITISDLFEMAKITQRAFRNGDRD